MKVQLLLLPRYDGRAWDWGNRLTNKAKRAHLRLLLPWYNYFARDRENMSTNKAEKAHLQLMRPEYNSPKF